MTQFETWKLLTDLGLLGSLIYFALRYLRNQSAANPHQLQELHSGLRNAIREADAAGKSLNEQLITRRQNLEKLLSDVQNTEIRLNKLIDSAEERKAALEYGMTKSAGNIQDLQTVSKEYTYQKPKQDLLEVQHELTEDQDEFIQAVTAAPKTNIFGEPLPDSQNTESIADLEHAFGKTPLTNKIEKQIELTEAAPVKKKTSAEEIYAKAEELLKAGKAIEEVSKQTDLTTDEVRMLAQMLDSDEQQGRINQKSADNRLGVLGGFKRQVQVL